MSAPSQSKNSGGGAIIGQVSSTTAEQAYKKAVWRLIPFLFVCYVVSYLDRTNIGFAQFQMQDDLGFTAAMYGLGAGIFFLGYALCEVPSNLLLQRIGTRVTLTRILILWGSVCVAMAWINSSTSFYISRFLLGAFEAGLFPAVLFFMTQWFPSARRGRVLSLFMLGMPISGVIGGPIAAWALNSLDGVLSLRGWQWLFIVEGIPAVLLGFACRHFITDSPSKSPWLKDDEQRAINEELSAEQNDGVREKLTFLESLRDPRLYAMTIAYFTFICGIYVIGFWLPTLIKEAGVSDVKEIGLYSTIPYCASAVAMVLISRSSDRMLERRWHTAICALVGAITLAALPLASGDLGMSLVTLVIGTSAIYSLLPLFWSLASTYYAGTRAAAGSLALINSLGLIGGFVSPFVMGWLKTTTGYMSAGLYVMAAALIVGSLSILIFVPRHALKGGAFTSSH